MIQTDQHRIVLITTNALDYPPFIFHKAIKFWTTDGKPLIIHQTTSGIEIIDYDTFMKGRHILHEEQYPVRFGFNPEHIIEHDHKKFDWLGNNCEDFTSHIIEQSCGQKKRPASPQRFIWFIVFTLVLITMLIYK